MLPSSDFARSVQIAAPSCSNPASASPTVERAAARCFARRCLAPSAERSSYERRRCARAAFASPRELEESEEPGGTRDRDSNGHGLRFGQIELRSGACFVDPAEGRGDERGGKPVPGHHGPKQRAGVERVGRVPFGQLPVPGPPLEEAEPPRGRRLSVRVVVLRVLPTFSRSCFRTIVAQIEKPRNRKAFS